VRQQAYSAVALLALKLPRFVPGVTKSFFEERRSALWREEWVMVFQTGGLRNGGYDLHRLFDGREWLNHM